MVNYDVDTDSRPRTYFVLASLSIVGSPFFVSLLTMFLPQQLAKYQPLGTALSRFLLFASGALSPFVIFVLFLGAFDYFLWRLPIPLLGRIPNLGGTWTGDLSRTPLDPMQPPETGEVNCRIRQTWRHIDFVFFGPHIPVPAPRGIMRRIHSTRGHVLTVGMFVKNRDNVHVRYIYAAGSMSMLDPHDVGERSGEGTAVLYLIRRASKKCLQGTYYGDKLRSGNVYLEYAPPWWARLLRAALRPLRGLLAQSDESEESTPQDVSERSETQQRIEQLTQENIQLKEEHSRLHSEAERLRDELKAERSKGFWAQLFGQ